MADSILNGFHLERARCSLLSAEILNLHRLNWLTELESKYARLEVELTIKRTLDVFRLPETMLLTREGHIGHRDSFGA